MFLWSLLALAQAEPMSCESVKDMVDAGVSQDDILSLVETEGVLMSDLSCVGGIIPLAPRDVTFQPYDNPYMLRENPYTTSMCDGMLVPSPMTAAMSSWVFGFGAGHYYAGSKGTGSMFTVLTLSTILLPILRTSNPNVEGEEDYNTILLGLASHIVIRAVDAGTAGAVAHQVREGQMRECPGPMTR